MQRTLAPTDDGGNPRDRIAGGGRVARHRRDRGRRGRFRSGERRRRFRGGDFDRGPADGFCREGCRPGTCVGDEICVDGACVPRGAATGLTREVYDMIADDFFMNGSLTSRSRVPNLLAAVWTLGRESMLVDISVHEAWPWIVAHARTRG